MFVGITNMREIRFDVRLDPGAVKEYQDLDNSVVEIVNKSIDELQYRADEVGKLLGNKSSSKLAGCKEIKLSDAGIRIIFKITAEKVDVFRIVYILAIEKRSEDLVFKVADKRLRQFKKVTDKNKLLQGTKNWDE